VSEIGSQVTMLGLPTAAIVIFDASAIQVGILTASLTLPAVVLGVLAGVWVDRLRRRPLMIVCDLVRAVALGSVPVAFAFGVLTLMQLYAVAVVAGAATMVFNVAYQSYLPRLVGRGELGEANSKMIASRSFAEVVGPALGGALVQGIGAARALALDAASFVVSAASLRAIREREARPALPSERRRVLDELREGLTAIRRTAVLSRLAACNVTLNLGLSISQTLFYLFAYRELGLGATLVGAVVAVRGVGALTGALAAVRLERRAGTGRVLVASTVLYGAGWLAVPAAAAGLAVPVLIASSAAIGAGNAVYNVTQLTLRQVVTPDRLLGRVNATMRTLFLVPQPIGALVAGGLATSAGYVPTLLIGGAIVTAAAGFLMSPSVRRAGAEPIPGEHRDRRIDTTGPAESDRSVSPVVPRFELSEERADSGAYVVSVRGEIHMTTAPDLAKRLTDTIDAGNTRLVLDLSGVEFIDSTGLSVLLSGLRQVTQARGAMALVCANPTVLRLFQITSLDKTFAIFAGREAAAAHVVHSTDGAP
jgi:anti-anti-sigma factor